MKLVPMRMSAPLPRTSDARHFPLRPAGRGASGFALRAAILVAVTGLLVALAPAPASAQDQPIYKKQPYDVLILKRDNQTFEILPLELPNRKVVMQTSGRLSFRMVKDPSEELTVSWSDLADIDLFEELVLEAAQAKVAEKKFDEAFDHFAFLISKHPNVTGLDRAVEDFLYQNAISQFTEQGDAAKALSTLEELYERNPDYQFRSGQTVVSAISGVTNKLLTDYNEAGDLASMRTMLRRLRSNYGTTKLASVTTWTQSLSDRAAAKRDELKTHLDANELREAHQAARAMMAIWPDVEGGRELALEANRRYPIVAVGVTELAPTADFTVMSDWAARRTSRLFFRSLLEFMGPGADGGQYDCPYGKVTRSDDLRQFTVDLNPDAGADGSGSDGPRLTGYDVARRLRELADPNSPAYLPSWAALVKQIDVEGVNRVSLELRRPNVLPEAMLQVPLEDPGSELVFSQGPYRMAETSETQTRFVRNPDYAMQGATRPAEVVERLFEDTQLALDDLRAGRIDVIDRLFPADAARIAAGPPDRNVLLQEYQTPTIHILVPNTNNPYLARATFRRALVYGIPRQAILDQLLLEGNPLEGCRVISGPFPAGKTLDDPLSYAYDDDIEVRPYEPRLAMLLRHLAGEELKQIAEQKEEAMPELQPLQIGHPASRIARMACKAIQMNLEKIGITCSLKEFPPGQVHDESGECDLVYMEVLVAEPVVDARRLLSAEGLAQSPSAYISLGLRRLDQASQWKDVSEQLHALHRLVHDDVTIIPLYQLTNFLAVHSGIEGVGKPTSSLYQNIENWRVQPQLDEDVQ